MDLNFNRKGKSVIAQASILKRIFAFIIDLLTIDIIILFPFKSLFKRVIPETSSVSKTIETLSSGSYDTLISVVTLAASFIAIAYFVVLEKNLGQTIGKRLLNLYVVSQTKELKYWQTIIRSIFLIPLFPFVLLWVIDPLVMLFTKENQRLSEILSKTKVVEKYIL